MISVKDRDPDIPLAGRDLLFKAISSGLLTHTQIEELRLSHGTSMDDFIDSDFFRDYYSDLLMFHDANPLIPLQLTHTVFLTQKKAAQRVSEERSATGQSISPFFASEISA